MNYCSPCSVNDEKFASAAAMEALKSSMTQKHGCVADVLMCVKKHCRGASVF